MEELHEKRIALRNALKEKYGKVIDEMYKENPTYTEDDLLDKFLTVCHGGGDGVKEVKIVDGKAILVYGEGIEVDFAELKAEWNELVEISKEAADSIK